MAKIQFSDIPRGQAFLFRNKTYIRTTEMCAAECSPAERLFSPDDLVELVKEYNMDK